MSLNRVIVVALIVFLAASMATPLAMASKYPQYTSSSITNELRKIDPKWRDKIIGDILEAYDEKTDMENRIRVALSGAHIVKPLTMFNGAQSVLVMGYPDALDWIKTHSRKVRYVARMSNGMILAYILATKQDVIDIAKHPSVTKIMPSPPLVDILEAERKKTSLLQEDKRLSRPRPLAGEEKNWSGIVVGGATILEADKVWEEYGIKGDGVYVGVVDTGVDFATPELGPNVIARDGNKPRSIVMDENFIFTHVVAVKNESGYLNTSGAWCVVYDALRTGIYRQLVFWLIYVDVDFYIGDRVESKSGIYKFGYGMIWFYDPMVTEYYVATFVPVVLVDTRVAGVYDTAIFDLSTAFYDFSTLMRQLENETKNYTIWRKPKEEWRDYSFADEPLIKWGNEIVARNFDPITEGMEEEDKIFLMTPDFSIGMVTGYYLDTIGFAKSYFIYYYGIPWYIVFGEPGVYPGLDPNGNYVALLNDFYGHGTEVASCIAAQGNRTYEIYTEEGEKLYGIAPNAKIVAGTGWLVGDLAAIEYWMAGYDFVYNPDTGYLEIVPAGKHRTDIISNSWSYVRVAKWGHQFPGWDAISWIFDDMLLIDYLIGNNVTIVFAAGNEGPGYNSLSTPSSGLLMIQVGGSVAFEYYQIFGYRPGYSSDIMPFASRGPTGQGYPRPDVVNIAGFEWAATRTFDGRGWGATFPDLFSGTSEATPLTSGALALAVQAFRQKYGYTPSPFELKMLLKSTAKDLGYPTLEQGAGLVNAYHLVKTILEDGVRVYIPEGIQRAFIEKYNMIYGPYTEPLASLLYDTAYYTIVAPGGNDQFTMVFEGSGEVSIEAIEYKKVYEYTVYDGYYRLTTKWIRVPDALVKAADYIEVIIVFQYTAPPLPYYGKLPYTEGYLIRADMFNWEDVNHNGIMEPGKELYRINTAARVATTAFLTLAHPEEKITGKFLIRLRRNPTFNYTAHPLPPVKVKIVLRGYKEVESQLITLPDKVTVNGRTVVTGLIHVPETTVPGLVDVKIRIHAPDRDIAVPVAILVPLVLDDVSSVFLGARDTGRPNDPFTPLGTGDSFYGDMPEGLDWRMLPVLVTDPEIAGVAMIARWRSGPWTSMAVIAVPPGGIIPHTWGGPQVFSAFKLSSDVGFVYNPSMWDQLHGTLRLYLPIKWIWPYYNLTYLWYMYRIIYNGTHLYEYWDYINPLKPSIQLGLYRLLFTYECYSGDIPTDTFGLRLVVIRSNATYTFLGTDGVYNYGLVHVKFKAGGYAPFLLADLYVIANTSAYLVSPGILDYVFLSLYLRWENGYVVEGYLINYTIGYYIGMSVTSNELELSYYIITLANEKVVVDTILVMYDYPWHASGYYAYNYTTDALGIGEIVYPGVVTATIVIEPTTQ